MRVHFFQQVNLRGIRHFLFIKCLQHKRVKNKKVFLAFAHCVTSIITIHMENYETAYGNNLWNKLYI